jgi:uncharacterized protein YyaL (SSP411 family)
VNLAALDWATATLLATPEIVTPSRVIVLLHEYARTGRSDIRDAAEAALADGLDRLAREPDPLERCQWLGALASARVFADDEHLTAIVETHLPATIDAVEHTVRATYEPGEGLLDRPIADQIRCAAALVTAFELTGRLPYSMMAEELWQFARRASWDGTAGALRSTFKVNCDASQLCTRLAVLHHDPEYIAAAVVAVGADYADDAERLLRWACDRYREHAECADAFGLALVHWFALRAHPN